MMKHGKILDPRAGREISIMGALLLAVDAALWGTTLAVEPLAMLESLAGFLFVVALIAAIVGAGLFYANLKKPAMPVLLAAIVVFALSLGGFMVGFLQVGDLDRDQPPPPPGYSADWTTTLWSPRQSTAHDANSEFPDAPFTACGSVSPAGTLPTTASWSADNTTKSITYRVAIDDDVVNTVAGYQVGDCDDVDFKVFLNNPAPAVGGGNQEIPFWGRISITRTAGTQNNGSYADVLYCDVNGGAYLGFGKLADSGSATHTNDHTYASYTSTIKCPGPQPLVGDWIALGTSDGDTDGEYVSLWYVLKNGLSDYTTPPVGSEIQLKIEIGTDPNSSVYTGDLETWIYHIVIDSRA